MSSQNNYSIQYSSYFQISIPIITYEINYSFFINLCSLSIFLVSKYNLLARLYHLIQNRKLMQSFVTAALGFSSSLAVCACSLLWPIGSLTCCVSSPICRNPFFYMTGSGQPSMSTITESCTRSPPTHSIVKEHHKPVCIQRLRKQTTLIQRGINAFH